ncbi:MAG: secondary thiamine-phosphate synthase enzyme YjbQ [Gammaproteobacteria bacterium]|nr:secondary thiamine-phosphate synthase enzyme YjbQ [Gammaproteobacteria bacterium]
MVFQRTLELATRGRGTHDISAEVQNVVADAGIEAGLCQVFVHHTSASLMLTENADPDVRHDLESFMSRLVPDGDDLYRHTAEGDDDMAAHVRSVLTQSGISLPVGAGRCLLGTWQGIYLWEHRRSPHHRRITVTVIGA